MVDPDIMKAIEKIGQKIDSLEAARRYLAEEFAISLDQPARSASTASRATTSTSNLNRKEALAHYIRVNGAKARADIVQGSGIPSGSISYCLSDQKYFRQLSDGRWDIVERHQQPELQPREAV